MDIWSKYVHGINDQRFQLTLVVREDLHQKKILSGIARITPPPNSGNLYHLFGRQNRRFARMTEENTDDDNDGCNDNYYDNFYENYDKNDQKNIQL